MKETRSLYMKGAHCGIDSDAEFCEFRAIWAWTEWIEDWRGFLIGKMKTLPILRLKKIRPVLRTRGCK